MVRVLQVLIRAVAMPADILAEGLRPDGRPHLSRVLLALWSGTGLAGPLLPEGPSRSAIDLAYSAGDGLHVLATRFLEHVGSTEGVLVASGVPGSRWLAWAVTLRQALGLGWRHALDLGEFARSLRPASVLDAILAAPGNWALVLGRALGVAGGFLGIFLGSAGVFAALRRRRSGEVDGLQAAVRVVAGLLTAAAGILAVVALVAAAPATAAGASFLSLVLGVAGLLLELRPVSRRAAAALRTGARWFTWPGRAGPQGFARVRWRLAELWPARLRMGAAAPVPAAAHAGPPTTFRWHEDLQLLVATEPEMHFLVEGVHRVGLPTWLQRQLRQAGWSVVTTWGNRILGAVIARLGAGLPGEPPTPPDWTALPIGRWLSSQWDAWIPVVEPGTTEVLLGRYDSKGRYTGRWRVVVSPAGTIADKRWIAEPPGLRRTFPRTHVGDSF